MKYCKACNIRIQDKTQRCPLCGGAVANDKQNEECINAYPEAVNDGGVKAFVVKLLLAVTIGAAGVCLAANFMIGRSGHWSITVLLSAVYAWLAASPLWKPGRNAAGIVLKEALFLCGYLLLLDLSIGWRGWSVVWAVPAAIITAQLTANIFYMVRKTKRGPYALFNVIVSLLGLIPALLHIIGLPINSAIALISFTLAVAGCLIVWVFGGAEGRNEFRRRFRF